MRQHPADVLGRAVANRPKNKSEDVSQPPAGTSTSGFLAYIGRRNPPTLRTAEYWQGGDWGGVFAVTHSESPFLRKFSAVHSHPVAGCWRTGRNSSRGHGRELFRNVCAAKRQLIFTYNVYPTSTVDISSRFFGRFQSFPDTRPSFPIMLGECSPGFRANGKLTPPRP